jgi:hypothetical protein
MPPLPTPEAWAQIRHEYENTRRSIEDICLTHGISANTLRRRVKAWGWTMRQPPIPDQGPPVRAEPDGATDDAEPSPHIAEPPDPQPASERLQGAAARVMRAIETTSARLTARPTQLRETEMAARALGSLTRTLRELNELLEQHKAHEPQRSTEELRQSVARKLEAVIAASREETPRRYLAGWEEFAAEAKQ